MNIKKAYLNSPSTIIIILPIVMLNPLTIPPSYCTFYRIRTYIWSVETTCSTIKLNTQERVLTALSSLAIVRIGILYLQLGLNNYSATTSLIPPMSNTTPSLIIRIPPSTTSRDKWLLT